jgi:xanthine dehydrogenase accessory factor
MHVAIKTMPHTPPLRAAAALQSAGEVDILRQAGAWHEQGREVAIATVVASFGSAPRPVGAKLAVSQDGHFAGSVSGGCVENAVITAALACIADGKPRLETYAGDAKLPWEIGLPCGGSIRVYIEKFGAKQLAALRAMAHGEVIVITELATGAHGQISAQETSGDAAILRSAPPRHPGLIAAAGGEQFADILQAPVRLLIVGATHLAQSLAAMAVLYGYDVSIIDPREAYLTAARFGSSKLILESPGQAVAAQNPDAATAIVTVSHDPKIDDPALAAALRSEAFYIGALGSRKSHEARRARLGGQGFDEAALARIHGPVGLNIGAVSPPEIAGSILAQMTQIMRAKA